MQKIAMLISQRFSEDSGVGVKQHWDPSKPRLTQQPTRAKEKTLISNCIEHRRGSVTQGDMQSYLRQMISLIFYKFLDIIE